MKYLLKIIRMTDKDVKLLENNKFEPERMIRVTKSIVLLIVSNMITLRDSTDKSFDFNTEIAKINASILNKVETNSDVSVSNAGNTNFTAYIDFATDIIMNIKKYSKDEELIIANNLLYSSLILFYNLIESSKSTKLVELLWSILNDYILESTHKQIIDIILELITLFTRYQDSCSYVLTNEKLMLFVFDKLTSKDPETLELWTLALSRISAELQNLEANKKIEDSLLKDNSKSENEENSVLKLDLFIKHIKQFSKFAQICDVIKKQESETRDGILIYYLNFLENSTSIEKVRENIQQINSLYKSMLTIFKEKIGHENCLSIINILFNISLTLKSAIEFDQGSLKKLWELYRATSTFYF